MGNTSKKLAAKCTLLTKEEQKYVAATFRAASKNSERIREDDLIVSATLDPEFIHKFWGPQMDPRLAQYLSNFLFGWPPHKTVAVDFDRFAELYVYNVRGSLDERLMVLYNSLGAEYNATSGEPAELPYQLVREYCESVASTYIKIVKAHEASRAGAWLAKGFRGRAQHVQALGEALAASAAAAPDDDAPAHHVSAALVARWLQTDTLLLHLSELVFRSLYGVARPPADEDTPPDLPPAAHALLPAPEGLEAMPDYPAFIDLSHIVWLNSHVPPKHRHKWRFLFSSHIHGESFATMAGRIQDQGASVLIVEDDSGYIFGGYAPHSWSLGPNWGGDEDSFLFTLAPKMRMYPSSGFNDHYQYLNHHTKTMPNGLLMGGQLQFGAIWVCADPFGAGSSAESCTTYRGYRRLSKEPTFKIRSLEVWAVGDKPAPLKDSFAELKKKESVLTSKASERKLLAIMGRPTVSDGFRD